MYHVTYAREVETCRKSDRDGLVHFVYRKDAEKYAAKEQVKFEAAQAERAAERLHSGLAAKQKLDALLITVGENVSPREAKTIASYLNSWKSSQKEVGTWHDEDEAFYVKVLDETTFKHERWLTVKYGLGHVNYGPRRVIYTNAHPDWIIDAVQGEAKYRKLAKVLLAIWAEKDGRWEPWVRP